jgi:hypothetical protein
MEKHDAKRHERRRSASICESLAVGVVLAVNWWLEAVSSGLPNRTLPGTGNLPAKSLLSSVVDGNVEWCDGSPVLAVKKFVRELETYVPNISGVSTSDLRPPDLRQTFNRAWMARTNQ